MKDQDLHLHQGQDQEPGAQAVVPKLDSLLRSLPRVEASPDFTERVLEGARASRSPRTELSWLRAAAAVLTLCGGALVAGWMWSGRDGAEPQVAESAPLSEESPSRGAVHPRVLEQLGGPAADGEAHLAADEVVQLRSRFYSLQQELDELRRLARSADPVVDLGSAAVGGSSEPVDYLMDLRALSAVKPEAVRTRY